MRQHEESLKTYAVGRSLTHQVFRPRPSPKAASLSVSVFAINIYLRKIVKLFLAITKSTNLSSSSVTYLSTGHPLAELTLSQTVTHVHSYT